METSVYDLFEAIVKAKSTAALKVPVNTKDGEIYIPEVTLKLV